MKSSWRLCRNDGRGATRPDLTLSAGPPTFALERGFMEAEVLPRFDPVPRRTARRLAFAAGFALSAALVFTGLGTAPAYAQGISLLRDTETEDMLRSYETPLAKAAGLDPGAARLAGRRSPEINAFATYGDGGENIFILSGILLYCKNPNELIGVMAHETGHIAAGHLSRSDVGMQNAMIPMLLSHGVGRRGDGAGAGEAGMVIMGAGSAIAQAQMAAFTRVQESTADQIAAQAAERHASIADGHVLHLPAFRAASRRRAPTRSTSLRSIIPSGQDRLADIERHGRCLALARREGSAAGHAHLRNGAGQAGRLHACRCRRPWTAIRKATRPSPRAMPAPWSICASPICPRRFPPPTA